MTVRFSKKGRKNLVRWRIEPSKASSRILLIKHAREGAHCGCQENPSPHSATGPYR